MRLFSYLGMLLGDPVSVVERFKPESTCELSTGGGGGGGWGEMAVIKKWPLMKLQLYQYTVTNLGRRYKCNPPMALFSRFNYKMELKLQKDHTSREFEAKFTDKIMQHLKDEGPPDNLQASEPCNS